MDLTHRVLPLCFCLTMVCLSPSAKAANFIDWWLTPDQQGRLYFEREDYQKSSRAFVDTRWKALSFYRAKEYGPAADFFARLDTAEGFFYVGNSYARAEKLPEAIEAYKKALEEKPDFSEAAFNLDWVTGLWELDQKKYDDAGGTDGQLGADKVVIDDKAKNAKSEMSTEQALQETGLSDAEIREMWMRRVQTTPGDFLRLKFQSQANRPGIETKGATQ